MCYRHGLARLVDEHETRVVSGRSSVTLKKNRSAVTVALMLCGCKPVSVRCSWNARSSSGVAVSGERPRKLASFLTARMYSRCVSNTTAHVHVFEHALAQRADGCLSLIGGSCLEVGVL